MVLGMTRLLDVRCASCAEPACCPRGHHDGLIDVKLPPSNPAASPPPDTVAGLGGGIGARLAEENDRLRIVSEVGGGVG